MHDSSRTYQELIEENLILKRNIKELEQSLEKYKLLEEDLRESEAFRQRIFESSRIPIVVMDLESGRYIDCNPAATEIYRYSSREETLGKTPFDVSAPQQYDNTPSAEKARFYIEKAHAEGMCFFEWRHQRPDGELWDALVHLMSFQSGGRHYLQFTLQDITEQKQVEEALSKSEEKFRKVFYTIPDSVSISRLEDGLYVSINPAFTKITGYTEGDIIGKTSRECNTWVKIEDRQKLVAGMEKEGKVKDLEAAFRMKNGEIRYGLMSASAIDLNGVPYAIIITQDITERRQAEGELHRLNRELRAISNCNQVLVREQNEQALLNDICRIICDEAGYCLVWVGYVEYDHEKTVRPVAWGGFDDGYVANAKLSWADDAERAQGPGGAAIRSGKTIYIEDFTTDPRMAPWRESALQRGYRSTIALPLKDENTNVFGVILIYSMEINSFTPYEIKILEELASNLAFGITALRTRVKRDQIAVELRESEERYRFIAENAHDVIWTFDLDSGFTYMSPSVERLRGFNVEEAIKQTLDQTLTPESYSGAMEMLETEKILEMHGKRHDPDWSKTIELEQLRKDGSTVWTEVIVNFLYDAKSGVKGIMGITRDITERKRAEEDRNSLRERLQRAEKMEALGTLAGGVAHDLNNVLGATVGFSELLAEKLSQGSPLRRYANNILKSSIRGAAIIQDLLTLARRGVTISDVVDLNQVVSDYLLTPEFETLKSYHTELKIRTNLENSLLNIKGSPIHIGKTIMNLVSNAAEAMSGNGEVTIKTENRYLDQPIRGYDEIKEGDYVVLTISDTGSGISASNIGKIFEPFYTKKVMGRSGTGLGLAVVWGTVKDHDGYIDVQSEEGKGSVFNLYFPATREDLAKAQEAMSTDAYMGRGESILVVDDVQVQRDLAMSMMERLGYQVKAVSGGKEAVAYLKSQKADLIVLDMIMDPGIDGMETYRRILEFNPGQKAILVSGFSETDRVREAMEMGAGTFVRKPYILEKIGLAVRKELDSK